MKTIVCYGDSNTWGFVPEKKMPLTPKRYDFSIRWPGVLQNVLGDGYRVVEEGLNGRTTVFDDPLASHRNGLKYIECAMLTNMPVDLLVIMLGTNDTKDHFSNTSFSISVGLERLVVAAKLGSYGHQNLAPEILILSPVNMRTNIMSSWLGLEFGEKCLEKDKNLSKFYRKIARAHGCFFMNAADYAETSLKDAVHLDSENHHKLATAIHEKVRDILK